MAYTPNAPAWVEGLAPGISAARLTHLETQYDEAAIDIATHIALTIHLVAGLIVMWHGTIANIPAGWLICDGNGGTPNLLAKFVQGVATAATDPGATGGSTAKTGTTAALPDLLASDFTGGGVAPYIADIRPLFYDIAFIMKT